MGMGYLLGNWVETVAIVFGADANDGFVIEATGLARTG
jgi:hypothetical protein